jgi:hypothetical protein
MFRPRTLLVLAALLFLAGSARADAAVSTLTLTVTGVGASVQASPAGRLAGCRNGACTYVYGSGTVVTLNATSNVPGATFARWLGACRGGAATCSVPIVSRRTVIARFTPIRIYADEPTGQGSVTASPPGPSCGPNCWTYPYASVVTLTATPAAGWFFRRWYGACANVAGASCRMTAYGNRSTSPAFDCSNLCTVNQPVRHPVAFSVNVVGGGGVGIGRSWVCRSPTCAYRPPRGTTLVFYAYRGPGAFTGWGGACAGRAPLCQTNASADAPTVSATFG